MCKTLHGGNIGGVPLLRGTNRASPASTSRLRVTWIVASGLAWPDRSSPSVSSSSITRRAHGERRRMIAASLQDTWWHDLMEPKDRPFLFVAEGVLLYLKPDDVARFIRSVSVSFPRSSILLDTIGPAAMKRQDSHPLMRYYDARFRWTVDDVQTLVTDNAYSVVNSVFLADLRRDELKCLPFMTRLLLFMMRRMRWFRESSRLVCLSSLDPGT